MDDNNVKEKTNYPRRRPYRTPKKQEVKAENKVENKEIKEEKNEQIVEDVKSENVQVKPKAKTQTRRKPTTKKEKQKIKIIPLGGLNEIGKNITVIEYKDEIAIIDCGLKFPEEDMFGIDIVIPDISYLLKNKDKIKGIFLTHGHEDHIGALPYVLKQINVPVYGTKLTLGIVETKLKEHNLLSVVDLKRIQPRDIIKLDNMSVEFIKTNHSIADSVAIAVHTPLGVVLHTGDFKIDYTPIDGEVMDFARFAELGKKGVIAMLADSTNVERDGYTQSEKSVGEKLEMLFGKAKGRILVATFASNIHRIQQIVKAAEKYGRRVAVSGRSMENIVQVGIELGYLVVEKDTMIGIDDINKYTEDKIVVITTGSQGEPMSALARMAASEHKKINIVPGDMVIISATPIPGNEKLVSKIINQLVKKGANVIYGSAQGIHVSGHACKEELKLMQTLVRPKFFIPVHGEYRHLKQHGELATTVGLKPENLIIGDNGDIIEVTRDSIKKNGTVTSGQIFVDGLGVGDVGNIVLRDRKHLSQDGILTVVATIERESGMIIAGPDIISRGFVYVRESEILMDEAREIVRNVLRECEENKITDWATLKSSIRDSLRSFLYEKTKRKPMILPIIMEI
ncbi:ribonuclease J [Clostridium sp. TW13]|uniref:Ribonuclease J n=2 Tax=Inconstantimicrobium mannanitabidum TaxID=1604901 RepID=A0ACB5RCY3_9CLOT|nr:ribonuclease J [Clostridium sp. TW13]